MSYLCPIEQVNITQMLYMSINKSEARRINKVLPRGSQAKIAKAVNKSKQHVSKVLTGEVAVTEDNYCIIEEAQRIIVESKAKTKKQKRAIKKVLAA